MAIPIHIKKILESAILAPSGDNCQPWQFQIDDNCIRLFNLPQKDTSLFNFRQCASMVAHGALVENIVIASTGQGYAARVHAFPDRGVTDLVATIDLEKTDIPVDPLFDCLPCRSTNRKRYAGVPLNDKERKEVLSAAQGWDWGAVRLLESGREKVVVARVTGLNDRLVFENRHLHDFLFGQIRWNDEEARSSGDGLDIKTLDLQAPDALAFKLFKHWPLLPIINKFGVSHIIGRNAERLSLSAAALGVVTVSGGAGDDDDAIFFNGGRLVQRVWLETTRCGLSFQPMTGIIFLMHRILTGVIEDFSPAHVNLIRRAFEDLSTSFGLKGETPVMLFRIGRSSPPRARSMRLPLERFLKEE